MQGALTDLVTPDGRGDSLRIHQDAVIQRLVLAAGESVELTQAEGRRGYLHLIDGELEAGESIGAMQAGDAVGLEQGESLSVTATRPVEGLWFDLP